MSKTFDEVGRGRLGRIVRGVLVEWKLVLLVKKVWCGS
jgi:hypothetical protein